MAHFHYKAIDENGRWSKGVLEAASLQHALDELRLRGLWAMKLSERRDILRLDVEDLLGLKPKVKTQHFTAFCRQLATMCRSGVGLIEAIRILAGQTESKPFRKVLKGVMEDMKKGTPLSAAIAAYPSVFSAIFVNMARAGEASGKLDEMLERVALFYEKEYYTREKVKSAMAYPAIMSVVVVLVIVFMMLFVIPKYVQNFEAMGIELPLATRIVMGISQWLTAWWHILLAVAAALAFLLVRVRKTQRGRYALDRAKMRLPVFGELWMKQAIARFTRTFGSLLTAGVPVMQALSVVSRVVNNEPMRRVIMASREEVRNGQSMATPLAATNWFSPMVVQMIAIGEKTGTLETMLDKTADFYEAEVDAMSDRLKSLLEPIMILFLAVAVGAIVMAILMPTFAMMEGLT
jgi:type IV pilus assembly protein PilC